MMSAFAVAISVSMVSGPSSTRHWESGSAKPRIWVCSSIGRLVKEVVRCDCARVLWVLFVNVVNGVRVVIIVRVIYDCVVVSVKFIDNMTRV